MKIVLWIVIVLVGYGLGNLNGAIVISKLLMQDDVRTHGSGNAGLTNFFRTYGGVQSLLVIAIDAAKCVLACLIAGWLLPEQAMTAKMAAGLATMVGHSYPAVAGFRGGKGILCGAALAACTDWRVFCLILGVFILTIALTRYVSLGSILAAVTFGAGYLFWHWGNWPVCILALAAMVFVIVRHRQNIGRLLAGNENKLSFHGKK